MIPTRRQIPAGDLDFVPGEKVTQDLPTKFLVGGYDLHLPFELTVADGSSWSSAQSERLQHGIVAGVKIVAAGGTVLHHFSGDELAFYSRIFRGARSSFSYVSDADLGSNGTVTGTFTFHLPVAALGAGLTPADPRPAAAGFATYSELTMLPSWGYKRSGLQLEVEWGDVSNLSDGAGDGTETLTVSPVLVERFARTESLTQAQRQAGSYLQVVRERRTYSVVAAEDAARFELPTGTRRGISRVIIGTTEDDGSGWVPSDAVIERLGVVADEEVSISRELPWSYLRDMAEEDYDLQGELPSGRAIIDFAEDGNLGQILGTGAFDDLNIVAKVATPGTSGNRVELLVESIKPGA